ncbi:GAF domain-containing protein [Sulfitobacter sp. 20_GPM-1509m]|uniref:GAF domain-containing protein n=1 Tax=Sulfitobacter sp. 20_GPM-1509m TaxID=1380367 RepID=UPI000A6D5E58|nr:GAF domain-containing protein [Sulfitobacter sp. 20_GPM-1509m]
MKSQFSTYMFGMDEHKDILTSAKAASILGVSTRTVQLWVEGGELPSWKTPGGHRRIPLQAVLDLVHNSDKQGADTRAYAIVLAGQGRGDQWRDVGLPGLGLLLEVTEDIKVAQDWLELGPPTLVVIEAADVSDRRKLIAKISSETRFDQTKIVSVAKTQTHLTKQPVKPRMIEVEMSPEVSSTSASIIQSLFDMAPRNDRIAGPLTVWNEEARLQAVKKSGLVGSEPDKSFDRLVRLAAFTANTPIAMFTLVTEKEQWFKARIGFDGDQTTRDWAFCNETIYENQITIIEDLQKSGRYSSNPTLEKPFGFNFYAGAPVRDPIGYILGSMCVIDVRPRRLNLEQREALETVADAVSSLVNLRMLERDLNQQQ